MFTVLPIVPLAQIVVPPPAYSVPSGLSPVAPPASDPASPIPVSPSVQSPPRPVDVVRPQQVRPLPGQLDSVPVFDSNSPEVIQTQGILLSTFPPNGMQVPSAHLNHSFQGRFELFAHHVAKGLNPEDGRTLFLGIIVRNPGSQPVTLDVLQAVSYLSQDAPFVDLPAYVPNPQGAVYAGPGSRVTSEVLRGERQPSWPAQIIIPPRSTQMLVNVPIPLRRLTVATDGTLPPGSIIPGLIVAGAPSTPALTAIALPNNVTPDQNLALLGQTSTSPQKAASTATALPPLGIPPVNPNPPSLDNRPLPLNGRTILMRLSSSAPVYVASLAMFAPVVGGAERVPSLAEWENLLETEGLAGPRDRTPTSPSAPNARFVTRFLYGRVAGIAQGSQWTAQATDPHSDSLTIPQPGQAISYVLSTVDRNTFGTGQIQSAPMLARYPDTAYRAHGNYGVLYNVSLPLYNNTGTTQRVAIMLQTPLQDERLKGEALRFRDPPYDQIFFRGTVRLRFTNDLGIPQIRYLHIVQRRGQEGEPLLRLTLPKGNRRLVEVQFIYPPDATPPQVLTVETEDDRHLAGTGSQNATANSSPNPSFGQPPGDTRSLQPAGQSPMPAVVSPHSLAAP
jgi:hypothetical protein